MANRRLQCRQVFWRSGWSTASERAGRAPTGQRAGTVAQRHRPARSVGARGGHEGPVAPGPSPHVLSPLQPYPNASFLASTGVAVTPSAQARAPTTIRPAVAGRLTAPRVATSSPFRCRSRARLPHSANVRRRTFAPLGLLLLSARGLSRPAFKSLQEFVTADNRGVVQHAAPAFCVELRVAAGVRTAPCGSPCGRRPAGGGSAGAHESGGARIAGDDSRRHRLCCRGLSPVP